MFIYAGNSDQILKHMFGILEFIDKIILAYNEYVGGYLLLLILIPAGLYFSVRFKFLQLRKIGHSIQVISGKFDKEEDAGDINHFRALTTALSATVGTGNIVGVALAIYWGGPGAILWMWLTGLLGMMLKFVECTLSLKYRKVNEDGSISGGPMYYMEKGLKDRFGNFAKLLAIIFAFATIVCSLGTGNIAQSNSISDVMFTNYNIPTWVAGVLLSVLVFMVIVGGIRRIAKITSRLVPLMAIMYFLACILIIALFYKEIPHAFSMIISDAFTGTAATGGFIGSSLMMTIRFGVARGLFSNEGGQGSAAIAHAAAKTKYAAREGLVASVGPFIDTLIICTLTALVVILTGAWKGGVEGVGMTLEGFTNGLKVINLDFIGRHIVAIGLLLFAFSTMISWSYYGDRATEYLFGRRYLTHYRLVFVLFVFLGAIWGIDIVWHFVDMVITFMTIPNLIAMILLAGVVSKEVNHYFKGKHDKALP